jgi:hypothetical protein
MKEESLYQDSNIVAEPNPRIGRMHIEKVVTEHETVHVAVIRGREETVYSSKCVNYVLDKETPLLLESLEITSKGVRELVAAIHSQFTDSQLEGLTGLLAFNTPENDLWLYEGQNQANSVLELYGCLFTNYSFKPVARDDERLMPYEELAKKAEEYNNQTYITEIAEVDEERYMEMLEVLPPCRWSNGVFYVSEAMIGSIHSMFCKLGEHFFEAQRDVEKTSNHQFQDECMKFIREKE